MLTAFNGEHMNSIISKEFLVKKAAPFAVVLGLGLTACGNDKGGSVEEQTAALHDEAVTLCTDQANVDFAGKYPEVIVGDKPTVAELKVALTAAEGRESEGAAFMQSQFDSCMDDNFNQPTQALIDQTINIAPSTTEVTVSTTQG